MHLQVPTQCDILSNDQHGRWHEIDTYVPRASQACVTRCTSALSWLPKLSTGLPPIKSFTVLSYLAI